MKEVKKRKKISTQQVKLSDQPEGYTFAGKYCGTVTGKTFLTQTPDGELRETQLSSVVLANEKGERTAYLADKGLLSDLEMAMVKEGDEIEIVKMPKRKLSKGRTMNQYDIYQVE